MKRLFSLMRRYLKECILGPLFKLLEATLELLVPLVVAAIVDRGIAAADIGYTTRMAILLFVFGLVGLGFSVTAQYFAARAAVGTVTRLRHDLLSHMLTLSHSEIDKVGTSTMLTRMTSDVNLLQNGINLALRLLLRSPFVVFGAMAVAFSIDVRSALIFLALILVLAAVVFGIMLVTVPLYKKVGAALDRVTLRTRENLTGVRPLRAFCKEKDECDEFRSESDALAASQTFVGRISALLNPLTFVLVNLGILVLLHTGALSVDGGVLTQGEVIALYNLMGQILVELIKLANLIVTITKAVASMHRIDAVFAIHSSQEEASELPVPVSGADAVTFRSVGLTYGGAGDASLSNISFSVPKGATVGVIGGTGSGKSSLVSLLLRHYDATAGEVLIDGVDIGKYPRAELVRRIAYVPQRAALFSGTLRDNLTWRDENADDDELYRALTVAQAKDFVDGKGGLLTPVAQGGKNFSGGQRQRLTVARALVGGFDILVLDDATSALDYATDAALRRALAESYPDATKFIVSQRASALLDADLILTLDDGELVGAGTHEELLDSCAVYREIYESQLYKEGGEA